MDSRWLLREEESVFFKAVVPSMLTVLQWMVPYLWDSMYGLYKLDSVGYKRRREH